jgi:nitrite reductase (NADH) small subunit
MANTPAEPPEFFVGDIDAFPKRKVVPAHVDGKRIGVLRHGDEIYAFADHCPHHGGPMCYAQVAGTMLPSEPNEFRYDLDGLVVKCPWHAYEFDVRTGRAIGDIIRGRLMVYRTEVRDRKVFIQLKRAQPAPAVEG